MRGYDSQSEAIFAYVKPESFVPKTHPLRAIRTMADEALKGMDKLFESMYATTGRYSIPPEKLLNAQLLMILYSIRRNRQMVEQIHYNFLYRWFLGMSLEERVWDHSSFSTNQERLIGSVSEILRFFTLSSHRPGRIRHHRRRPPVLGSRRIAVCQTIL